MGRSAASGVGSSTGVDFGRRYGPLAVVTGAAGGIGAGFADSLAARGLDLLLTDIDGDRLAATAEGIRARSGRAVDTVIADMADRDGPATVLGAADRCDVGLVVCNHLMPGGQSQLIDADLTGVHAQLDANVRAYVELAHGFGSRLRSRGRGGMILMSSLTGVVGSPYVTLYGASKAFVLAFGSGLAYELRSSGVDVLTLVPSSVNTETYRRAEQRPSRLFPPMEVEDFVAEGLRRLGKDWVAIPGRRNAFTAAVLSRVMPRRAAISTMGRNLEKLLGSSRP